MHPVHVAAGQAFLFNLTLFRVAVFIQGNRRGCPDQNDCTNPNNIRWHVGKDHLPYNHEPDELQVKDRGHQMHRDEVDQIDRQPKSEQKQTSIKVDEFKRLCGEGQVLIPYIDRCPKCHQQARPKNQRHWVGFKFPDIAGQSAMRLMHLAPQGSDIRIQCAFRAQRPKT